MFRAVVKVTHYSKQGWDSYTETSEEFLEGVSIGACEKKAAAYIKSLSTAARIGDFGIVLSSQEAKLVRIEEFSIVKEVQ